MKNEYTKLDKLLNDLYTIIGANCEKDFIETNKITCLLDKYRRFSYDEVLCKNGLFELDCTNDYKEYEKVYIINSIEVKMLLFKTFKSDYFGIGNLNGSGWKIGKWIKVESINVNLKFL